MTQSKEELEVFYKEPDPWGYTTNPEDIRRKKTILDNLQGTYKKALDLGCGEGWITKDLPAEEIYGYDISDYATSRFPKNVKKWDQTGKFDLVLATGVLYKHYSWEWFLTTIKNVSCGTVLLCNIAEWEVPEVERLGTPVKVIEFPYREYTERIRIYDFTPSDK